MSERKCPGELWSRSSGSWKSSNVSIIQRCSSIYPSHFISPNIAPGKFWCSSLLQFLRKVLIWFSQQLLSVSCFYLMVGWVIDFLFPLTDWEVNSAQQTWGEHAGTVLSQTDTNASASSDPAGGGSGFCYHGTVSQSHAPYAKSHTHAGAHTHCVTHMMSVVSG